MRKIALAAAVLGKRLSDIKAGEYVGAAVFLGALKAPDGSLGAARVIAEKNGVKPPI